MRLLDKVAIVTGGGRGIGRGIARMFAQEGARVILAGRTESDLRNVEREIADAGGTAEGVVTDISRTADAERMVRFAVERFGRLDVLVNNSGIGGFGLSIDDPKVEETYDRLMATNLRGIWMAAHYAVPHMKKAGKGSIINIASVHAWNTSVRNSAYAASKGGLIAGTRGLALELAPFLIRVNAISPGTILNSDFGDYIAREYGERRRKEYLERFSEVFLSQFTLHQPLPIYGTPEDIAYCATYLASEESRFVTGANITIDGGMTARLAAPLPLGPEKQEKLGEMQAWLQSLELESLEKEA